MADVFLSYASENRARITPLADALIAAGHSLWWDRHIAPGADFAETIEREIRLARVVIVAWSQASARSQWVRDEAAFGREAGILLPLLLDVAEPPMGFRQLQAIDFRTWTGDARAPEFVALAGAVQALMGAGAKPPGGSRSETRLTAAAASPAPRLRLRTTALVMAVLLFALLAVALFVRFGPRLGAPTIAAGEVLIERFQANPPDPARDARAASYAASFRSRFTEAGIRNVAEGRQQAATEPELRLSGELGNVGEQEFLTISIDDRASGASLWSIRREPTEGAAWESNLAVYGLRCALERRAPQASSEILSRYIQACVAFLEGDFLAQYAAAKDIHDAAPDDLRATAFLAFSSVGFGWAQTNSTAERDRLIGEGKRLAKQVLETDPHNAEALFAMGFSYDDYSFREQERYWVAAIEADPEFGPALGRYSSLLLAVGRVQEASDYLARAQLRRPLSNAKPARLAAALGDWEQARTMYRKLRPFAPARVDYDELQTTILYGDIEQAAGALERNPGLAGNDAPCFRQLIAARRKDPIDLSRLAADCSGKGGNSVRFLALAGDLDGAFRALESWIKESYNSSPPPELFWPEMHDFLRDDRFWPLATRFGLVSYWTETQQWPDFCSEPDLPFDCRERAAASLATPSAAPHAIRGEIPAE